jgi:hypothetical protein
MRIHAFEFMDQPWLPETVRAGLTDSLRGAEQVTGLYDSALPLLRESLALAGETAIVDLCSGSGGPMVRLFGRLREEGVADALVLTDLYPRPESVVGPGVRYETSSVDATALPEGLSGIRVICNAFHHFPPAEAKAILHDAWSRGRTVVVLEALAREPLAMVAVTGVGAMAAAGSPFFAPFRLSRVVLSTLIPVIPLLLLWEGVVSCLRCYTSHELMAMTASMPGYRWQSGTLPSWFFGARVRWFRGVPLERRVG